MIKSGDAVQIKRLTRDEFEALPNGRAVGLHPDMFMEMGSIFTVKNKRGYDDSYYLIGSNWVWPEGALTLMGTDDKNQQLPKCPPSSVIGGVDYGGQPSALPDGFEDAVYKKNPMLEMIKDQNAAVTRRKCECGVDTLGHGNHSDWCPKHE